MSQSVPESLLRAAQSSAVFRELYPRLTIFPLRPILRTSDGVACTCALGAECGSIGKHPAVKWSELEAGAKVGQTGCGHGIATGVRSGVFVVDLDGEKAISTFEALGTSPATFTVRRGYERAHVYFQHPGFHVKTGAGDLAKGIDVRGDGGFVVCPGSPHASGDVYEVLDDLQVADAPAWLLEWPGLRRSKRAAREYGEVAPVPLGSLDGQYARKRIATAKSYLLSAPLSIEGLAGRNVFFSLCIVLVRRMRLPIDVAADLVDVVYNPRLRAIGTTTWGAEETLNRLESARDTASEVPPGDIMNEATWLDITRALRTNEVSP